MDLCSPWAEVTDLPKGVEDKLPPDEWEQVLLIASEALYNLSGRQHRGTGCEATVTVTAAPATAATLQRPEGWDLTHGLCWCNGLQDCARSFVVRLPDDPVTSITEVRENGEVLPDTAYRLESGRWLRRLGEEQWHTCSRTLEVSYGYGRAVSEGGKAAAAALAAEIGKARAGDGTSQLPTRLVSQINRQGVTYGLVDRFDYLERGRTGIYLVDLFLAGVNPDNRSRASRVWSPDTEPTLIDRRS